MEVVDIKMGCTLEYPAGNVGVVDEFGQVDFRGCHMSLSFGRVCAEAKEHDSLPHSSTSQQSGACTDTFTDQASSPTSRPPFAASLVPRDLWITTAEVVLFKE